MTCKCFARCEADCVCDHDWTPPEVLRLRAELTEAGVMLFNQAKSIKTLTAELAECRKDAERMRTVGTRLSNVAFNLAQRCGHTIDSDDVSILDGLRKQWDALTIRQVDRL